MRVAFYAPLKAPDHPVPSGDRLMARLILRALAVAGHQAGVVSDLRAFLRDPADRAGHDRIAATAAAERDRIAADWAAEGPPDAFLCYHPYYKAPDLIGPALGARFGLPYLTVETSLSARRDIGLWAAMQARVREGAAQAALNICLTARDEAGLHQALPGVRTLRLAPFVDTTPLPPMPEPGHLVTVAMMRPGDKMESYRHLAAALARVSGDWRLTVAGDGEMRAEVAALFAPFGDRVRLAGQLAPDDVLRLMSQGSVYAWPGCGEAYGLAYLEAQAAGLPVVAFRTAGVPEVVCDGETGILAGSGDVAALAAGLSRLVADDGLRARMAGAAQARVAARHSLASAARGFDRALRQAAAA
ncbi:MAG: glycosyltransferase family 4 protein [Paracoccaceae bacterium]|nr:MAG: glycosyltransferase family 4 protein [Paracoccaceae bacterium]